MAKTRIAKNALNAQKTINSVKNKKNGYFTKDHNAQKNQQAELIARIKAKQAKKNGKGTGSTSGDKNNEQK